MAPGIIGSTFSCRSWWPGSAAVPWLVCGGAVGAKRFPGSSPSSHLALYSTYLIPRKVTAKTSVRLSIQTRILRCPSCAARTPHAIVSDDVRSTIVLIPPSSLLR